jgi:hypothetical protein
MRTLSALVAIAALLLTVATFPIIGAVLFALLLFFPLFLLGLLGVMAGLEDQTVRHHTPSMNPTAWRDGSEAVDAHIGLDRDPDATARPRERRAA